MGTRLEPVVKDPKVRAGLLHQHDHSLCLCPHHHMLDHGHALAMLLAHAVHVHLHCVRLVPAAPKPGSIMAADASDLTPSSVGCVLCTSTLCLCVRVAGALGLQAGLEASKQMFMSQVAADFRQRMLAKAQEAGALDANPAGAKAV